MNKNLTTGFAVLAAVAAVLYAASHAPVSKRLGLPADVENEARLAKLMREDTANSDWQPAPSASGLALASHVAQLNQDWERANQYLQQALTLPGVTQNSSALQQMALALSAGNYPQAVEKAQLVLKETGKAEDNADNRTLAGMLLITDAVRQNDLAAARKLLNTLENGAIAGFVKPIFGLWVNGDNLPTTYIYADPTMALHHAMAAEFKGKQDIAKRALEAMVGAPVPPLAAEMAAAIALRMNDRALAAKFMPGIAGKQALSSEQLQAEIKTEADLITPGGSQLLSWHMDGAANGLSLALMDIAGNLMKRGAPDSAMLFVQMGRLASPGLVPLLQMQANILQDSGHADEAQKLYESVTPDTAGFVAVQLRLAELLAGENKLDDAAKRLEAITPRNAQVLYSLGDLYRRQDKNKSAVDAYTEAMDLDEKAGRPKESFWFGFYFRAMAYDNMKDWDKAEMDLKQAVLLKNDDPHLLNYLGYSWADRGENLADASAMLEQAVKLAPRDAYIIDSVGWVAFRQGDLPKALHNLELAIALKPYDPTINDHLGDVYDKLGRTREAQYQWLRALTFAGDAEAGEDKKLVPQLKDKLDKAAAND